jgi:hypothetical protein
MYYLSPCPLPLAHTTIMEYRFEYYDSLGVIRKNNQLIVIIHIVFLYHCDELLDQSVHDPTL